MDFSNPSKLALLSPFELKDALIQTAKQSNRLMLNAGAATRISWRLRHAMASSSSANSP